MIEKDDRWFDRWIDDAMRLGGVEFDIKEYLRDKNLDWIVC